MDSILVTKVADNHWVVRQGDRSSGHLGYDEMLGLFAALTMPKNRPCVGWMKTDAQHKHQEEYFESIKERNSILETQEVNFESNNKPDEA